MLLPNTVLAGSQSEFTDRTLIPYAYDVAGAVQVFAVSSVSGLSEAERRQADHAPAFLCAKHKVPRLRSGLPHLLGMT